MKRSSKSGSARTLGQRLAPPRFIAFVLISIAAAAAAIRLYEWPQALLVGFDVGAVAFLLSCIPLLDHEADRMRQSARDNDANRAGLLAITAIVSLIVLVAIGVELAERDRITLSSGALIVGTLLIAWLFSNMIYALHYAHLFYSPKDRGGDGGGVSFPGEDNPDDAPDYTDFIYFAFTLGMTFQTSDVEITTRPIRRIATAHCFAAFVFNLGVLAFTINILGS